MFKILQAVNQRLTVAVPAAMAAGFAFGLVLDASFLKQWIMPLTFLMVYPMMVNLKMEKVFSGGDLRAQALAQTTNFTLLPFLAFGLGALFFPKDPALALGLFLVGMIPTSGMTISWTGFAGGNKESAVKMTVIGLALGAVLAPLYARLFFGASLSIEFSAFFHRIALIVLVPTILGYLTRRGLVRRYGRQAYMRDWAERFPPLATLGVLSIVFTAMALKAPVILRHPEVLALILVPLALFYGAAYVVGFFTARTLLERGEDIALVYGTVMRNLAIALALAMNAFGEAGASAALVVAVAFVVQVQSAAGSVHILGRIFDEPGEPVQEVIRD